MSRYFDKGTREGKKNKGRGRGGKGRGGKRDRSSERGGGRGRAGGGVIPHPAGLTGREIGMWYAQQSRGKPRKQVQQTEILFFDIPQTEQDAAWNLLLRIDPNAAAYDSPVMEYSTRPSNPKICCRWHVEDLPWLKDKADEDETEQKFTGDDSDDDDVQFISDSRAKSFGDDTTFAESAHKVDFEPSSSTTTGFLDSKYHAEQAPGTSSMPKKWGFDTFPRNASSSASLQSLADSTNSAANSERDENDFGDVEEILVEADPFAGGLGFGVANKGWTKGAVVGMDMCGFDVTSKLPPNTAKSSQMRSDFVSKQGQASYLRMVEMRQKLPAWDHQREVVETIEANPVTVISGETGCGKSTQVPQFLLDHAISNGLGAESSIVVTQPRRISAIALAERVAQERCDTCGGPQSSVGYTIRMESRTPRDCGSILYCTTGIVLRWLSGDARLSRITHLVLDEIHERDVTSDFLLIIVRDLLSVRPDLKLVLMSATLDASKFSEYFGNAPIVHIPGFMFPVEEFYLENILDVTGYKPGSRHKPRKQFPPKSTYLPPDTTDDKAINYDRELKDYIRKMKGFRHQTKEILSWYNEDMLELPLIIDLVSHIVQSGKDGSILIFLPGWTDISDLNKLFMNSYEFRSSRYVIIPLHSMLPTFNQKLVFQKPPSGVRKIVIATNIAETSITIDDIVFVIDSGKIKMTNFDMDLNVQTLQPEWVSVANSRQRKGRAGRVQAGVCYHMYTSVRESFLEPYIKPEMLRMRLENLCLQIKLMQFGPCIPFLQKALEPPSIRSLRLSLDELFYLGAITMQEQLTPLGRKLAQLPVDPHCGKVMIYGSIFGCLDPILTVAATLDFKDPFVTPMGKERDVDAIRKSFAGKLRSDHLTIANAFADWEDTKSSLGDREASVFCHASFLSQPTLKMLQKMKKQFGQILYEFGFTESSSAKEDSSNGHLSVEVIQAVLFAGLYPKVVYVEKTFSSNRPAVLSIPSIQLRSARKRKIEFHPKSVNKNQSDFPTRYLVYHLLVMSSSVYLHDTTPVSPIAMVLLGGSICVQRDNKGATTLVIDEWIKLGCNERLARLLVTLRKLLDHTLERCFENPEIRNHKNIADVVECVCRILESESYFIKIVNS